MDDLEDMFGGDIYYHASSAARAAAAASNSAMMPQQYRQMQDSRDHPQQPRIVIGNEPIPLNQRGGLAGGWHVRSRATTAAATYPTANGLELPPQQQGQAYPEQQTDASIDVEAHSGPPVLLIPPAQSGWHGTRRPAAGVPEAAVQATGDLHSTAATPKRQRCSSTSKARPAGQHSQQQELLASSLNRTAEHRIEQSGAAGSQQRLDPLPHAYLREDDWLDAPAEAAAGQQRQGGLFQRSVQPSQLNPASVEQHTQQQASSQQRQQLPQQQQLEEADAAADDDDEDTTLISADFDLSREDVIERIEQLVHQLVSAIAAGQLPELTCVSTAANNVVLAHRDAAEDDQQQYDDEDGQQQQRVLRLGSKLQKKTMLGSGGQQAYSIARVLQLLDVVHGLLRQGRTATQRDIYYTLLGPPFFNRQRDLTATIHTTLSLLRVPRSSLGITAASKGAVAGRLLLRSRPGEAWQDCSLTGPAGRSIPGEIAAIQAMSMRPAGARFILVVEKDAVFQRLVEDRLFDDLPCIIITGRGMPDIASRAFLAALVAAAGPGLPVLGLVDWNPAGVYILLSYKYGTAAMGLEAARYAVPSLCWLGINSDMLQDVPQSACQELTSRDLTLLPNLKAKLADNCPDWVLELEEMEASGLKADIEALYGVLGHQGLSEELTRRVLAQQYLA